MNSIKNAIVTVTLLAVGYGAYQVLKNPSQDDFGAFTAQNNLAESSPEMGGDPLEAIEPPEIEVAQSTTEAFASPAQTASQFATEEKPFVPPPLVPTTASPLADEDRETAITATAPPLTAVDTAELASANAASPGVGGLPNRYGPVVNPALAPPASMTDNSGINVAETSPIGSTPPIDDSLGPIPSAAGSPTFEQVWLANQQQVRERNLVQALAALSPWHNDPSLSDEQRKRCRDLLDQLAGTVIYSRQHLLEPEYIVQPGETLEEIATRYSVPQELLAKINGIAPPYALATGEPLKVVRGPFRAELNLGQSSLVLYLGSNYAGSFAVSLGQDLPRQEAFYRVADKSHGRNYFDRRSGQEILKGAANNRYGDFWIGLRGEQITSGHSVGIHGRPSSPSPNDIGSISLETLDAEDVYSILSVGSRVQIRR